MRFSRSKPGFVVSSAVHAGLLLATLLLFSDSKKFDDAMETVPVEVVSDSQFNQIMKGEKTAREVKTAPRVDKVADVTDAKPHPPLADAKKDVPTPPPALKRLADPGEDEKLETPTPPKRVAALPPPAPTPPPERADPKPAPTPPAKPKAAAPEPEKAEPAEAEIVRPKPPTRPTPEKTVTETPPKKPAPEKPKADRRLKIDEVAKLLQAKRQEEKPDRAQKPDDAKGELAEKPVAGGKPKSGDETAPKSKFDAASISNLLSRETPQQRASTGREKTRTASLGAPTGTAAKMSPSMEARIGQYIKDHYHPCWASGLSLGGETYAPIVEFRLSREGALEGYPRLLNPTSNPVARARADQALQAVRRCSPMTIPTEFMPYYEEALHEVSIKFTDMD